MSDPRARLFPHAVPTDSPTAAGDPPDLPSDERPDSEYRRLDALYQAERLARLQAETRLRKLEQRLEQSEAAERMLDALMEYVPEGIAIADAPDATVHRVSRFGQLLAGQDRQALEDVDLAAQPSRWALYHADGVTPASHDELPLARATRRGEVVLNEEWVQHRPSGEKLTILCNAGPIRNEVGTITGGVLAWRDITGRKRLQERLHVLASARCLLWSADVEEVGEEKPRWSFHFPSEEAALRFLPIRLHPGEGFVQGWYRSRLPEDRDRMDRLGNTMIRAGRGYTQEGRCRMDDGSVRWLQEDVQVEVVEEGRRWRVVGVCVDITQSKQAEMERRTQAYRLRLAMQAGGMGAWEWSAEGDRVTWSEELAALFGVPLHAHDGTNAFWIERVHSEDYREYRARFEQCLDQRQPVFVSPEHRISLPDGSVRWHQVMATIQYDPRGRPLWMVGIAQDVTDRRARETEVSRLNEQLRRSMAETHHRVKNNLQTISGMVELQMPEQGEAVPVGALQRIGQHVGSLAGLHDLLTQEARTEGDVQTVSAQAVLEKLLPLVGSMLQGRELVWDVEDARLMLRQASGLAIFVNEAVSNALKHGGTRVELSLRVEQEQARLEVTDNGPGFPPGFDAARDANTGLGLMENVARFDLLGELFLDNAPGGGARLAVTFPLATLPDR